MHVVSVKWLNSIQAFTKTYWMHLIKSFQYVLNYWVSNYPGQRRCTLIKLTLWVYLSLVQWQWLAQTTITTPDYQNIRWQLQQFLLNLALLVLRTYITPKCQVLSAWSKLYVIIINRYGEWNLIWCCKFEHVVIWCVDMLGR